VGVVTARLAGKRVVSAAVAVPALVLLLATTRTWLTGRSAEPLLGGGAVSATGSQVAPGVLALALVCLVALVTTLTGGPAVRRVSSVVLVLAAAGAVALTAVPLTRPAEALGRVAATGLGRTGVVATSADVSPWAWSALVAGVVLVLTAVLAAVAARRWSGLSNRFDAPGNDSATATRTSDVTAADTGRGTRRTAWDELTGGRDPTADPAPETTTELDAPQPPTSRESPDGHRPLQDRRPT
jgi:uncharacterized membrane protein (TIGR02234 family)